MKRALSVVAFCGVGMFYASAQKLPSKQTVSVIAPTEASVDGKATEWGNSFQAYNNNIETFYTIANNGEKITLILHAKRSRIIEKIIEGGVSITFNTTGKKDDPKSSVVLFPLMPLPRCKGILVAAGKSLTGKTYDNDGNDLTASIKSAKNTKQDTASAKANEMLRASLKEIKIAGMPNVVDSIAGVDDKTAYYRTLPLRAHKFKIIPINNKNNIEAMVQFDSNGELNYELAIPIKHLFDPLTPLKSFFYNITINGRGEDGRPGNTWQYAPPPQQGILNQDLEEPTDFWGEYILAQKQ
ncbi:hypothetical protein [Mucilaginibacter myungsuensis]|uniref:Uncharacterized protein n=1 Tax=Mucilaginibacter myungsuensis TaxID=649104 RepID=A0A929KV65_9SPHI|nr:hypothetical protein [Mucilaginibacter myungsuensis]MBE9661767.1 hypothetical protein [Mucilaginibacter myungsuensis]MDN3599799.1 hypothetical protein [Mucilaginibacter myungsuensis]